MWGGREENGESKAGMKKENPARGQTFNWLTRAALFVIHNVINFKHCIAPPSFSFIPQPLISSVKREALPFHRKMKMSVMAVGVVAVALCLFFMNGHARREDDFQSFLLGSKETPPPDLLMVDLTLIPGAAAKGAVCLDGTLPGYHFHPGFGSGANSWFIQLEGGGWCNDIKSCVFRKTTRRGSSKYMEKKLAFTGILSNKAEENPDFFNWNRVKLRYCDGASFIGEGQNKAAGLYFGGQRIFEAGMEELMSKGMKNADQALLSGCSAGGLASILHCDEFGDLFPKTTKVKCLSDAGFFLDATNAAGGHTMRNLYAGVVSLQGVENNLPSTCTSRLDPTSCFFPENLVSDIKTPLFILNAAYDAWQFQESLVPSSVDPHGEWKACKLNRSNCNSTQIQFLQDFRIEMLDDVKSFAKRDQNGLFINSCFAHCQTEKQDTWFADDSPLLGKKKIAESVGDWYFDRRPVKAIDCPYPCDNTCHNLVFD